YGDRYRMREGAQTWQPFEYKQFRYLQLVFRHAAAPISVDRVSLLSYEYPAERRGQFECSNEVLTKLWTAAVDTTYLQMEDTIVCDACRERSSWGGDGAHGEYAVWAGFGETALCDWHFRLLARGRMADGMLHDRYPCTEGSLGGSGGLMQANVYDNPGNIPQHALVLAVLLSGDYYHYFGRRALLEELYPTLVGLAGWCERHADDTGLLYGLGNWNWVDWSPSDLQGANFQTNAFYAKMLDNMARVAEDLGYERDAQRWAAGAAQVRTSLHQLHWDAERGAFVDSVVDGQQSPIISEVANGLALLFGIADGDQQAQIVKVIGDPASSIGRASPLFFYYVIEGLLHAGAHRLALTMLRERFAPMMAYADPPSIWEAWQAYALDLGVADTDFADVLPAAFTHSGGVGPAWTLSKHVLGVAPQVPGLARCRIAPACGDLDWARGVLPSVHGDIAVAWKRDDGCMTLDVSLPVGVEAELLLPRDLARAYRLTLDGTERAIPASVVSLPAVSLTEDHVGAIVTGGSHRLTLTEA
ncbi:MAG: hypothetical protein GX601_04845, partial [Anaerolineales bacterium]|nr:hypothetical protein [Anaerolineales bacterium]